MLAAWVAASVLLVPGVLLVWTSVRAGLEEPLTLPTESYTTRRAAQGGAEVWESPFKVERDPGPARRSLSDFRPRRLLTGTALAALGALLATGVVSLPHNARSGTTILLPGSIGDLQRTTVPSKAYLARLKAGLRHEVLDQFDQADYGPRVSDAAEGSVLVVAVRGSYPVGRAERGPGDWLEDLLGDQPLVLGSSHLSPPTHVDPGGVAEHANCYTIADGTRGVACELYGPTFAVEVIDFRTDSIDAGAQTAREVVDLTVTIKGKHTPPGSSTSALPALS